MKSNVSKNNYKKYTKKMIYSDVMGIMVWMALTTFSLTSRSSLGVDNIPVLELIMAVVAILGVKSAHTKYNNIKVSQALNVIVETIFLVALTYILVFKDDLALAGFAIYAVIIVDSITRRITGEAFRKYEQIKFNTKGSARFLAVIRNRCDTYSLIGSAMGSIIAVIFITVLHTPLVTFALYMVVLNIIQNGYDYYLWFKYLK